MKQVYFLTCMLFFSFNKLSAQVTDVVILQSNPWGLVLHNNDLYITESTDNKISKIDITDDTPTVTDVVDGVSRPAAMALNGNDLYIAEYTGDKISKITITDDTPTAIDVVNGVGPIEGVAFIGNNLYLSGHGEISRIDITDDTPTVTELVTGLLSNPGIVASGNDLFNSLWENTKIIKFTDAALSIRDVSLDKIKISPNPSNEFIQISNLQSKESYTIYDVLGAEIKKGSISNKEKIDIRNFNNGLYFLKFGNGNTVKFIKE